ncbi:MULTISPECIES: Flp pilus assembly protein CpaB [Ralstonia solanacearum species complex]|uniref:Flp pilus assembly protein CpaB n=1 Tax=Ralstonia syzygii TaxID=28097 RepID=A0ABX7ZHW3_9RALS|nr:MULTISPECIES: Flp pilus assembly protein CpaB [Ralstonia solanacearum species complex]BEU72991.1 Flp pilus assembly protein CpaB [Ralstonia pseudosolanacearum]AMP38409.1 Flp pilus assembly protein CpaB [Ralstonia solanacearum]AXV77811.1 Flp pilus assembly protein CpaB [Ralstonia solanacearum]AXV87238.1 Flp pilus assembly protein CpaB [Ralstonia solanacearum]AXV91837.1 Flp pilus assembly protein CpaB [Ralstonia solanacearum]
MKNLRILSMLLIATIAGLAAVVFASRWLTQQSSSGITKVVVAAADIDLGQRLSPDFIKTVDWPTASLPPGSISDTHALDGRVVRTSLTRGEPVLESKLTPQGTAGGLSAVIADGKRAITVRVNDVVGVAGFALPGSYVDIIVNTIQDSKDTKAAAGDRADQSISKIVLEKILVLAVAQEVNRDDTKPKVVNAVTLEVTPDQAEKLDLARSVGTLSLVLRNQVDPHPADTNGATKRTLLKEPAITAAVAVPVVRTVQVVHHVERHVVGDCIGVIAGTQHSQECF